MATLRSARPRVRWGMVIPLTLMMVPGLIYLFINNYLPMAGMFIAFKDYDAAKGFLDSDWIGFQNFAYLFSTSDAWLITSNTLVYNGTFLLLNLLIPISLALLLNEIQGKVAARFFQSIILIPTLISMVIVSYLVLAFLQVDNGFLNRTLLPALGIQEPISWYSEPQYWPIILPLVHCWKNMGFYCVIYYAAIIGIDRELYEAATIDGAGKARQVRLITLPLLVPVIIMMTVFGIGRIFNSDFGLFYQVPLNSGALYDTTNVIDTYVYRGLLQLGDIGMSSAAALYQSVVGFTLVMVTNLILRKFSRENAIF